MTAGEEFLRDVGAAETGEENPNGLRLVIASTIKPEPVAFAWEGRIPLQCLTLLVGLPGLGKSSLTTDVAARATRGQLSGDLRGVLVHVVVATAEDARSSVVVPRLTSAGADLDRVHFVDVFREGIAGDPVLPDDVDALEDEMRRVGARLLIVDPIVAHLSGQIDAHKDQSVRRVLARLKRLAESLNASAVGILHLNKASSTEIFSRVSGSVGFQGAARSMLLVAPDPQDPEGPDRILAQAKSNVGPVAASLRFRIEGRTVEGPDGPINTCGVAWLGEAQVRSADLLTSTDSEERTALGEATNWLREMLEGGPRPPKDIRREARGAGISEATLGRAKSRLGVRSVKRGGYFGGDPSWDWRLPEDHAAEGAHTRGDEHLQGDSGAFTQVSTEGAHISGDEHLQGVEGTEGAQGGDGEYLQELPAETPLTTPEGAQVSDSEHLQSAEDLLATVDELARMMRASRDDPVMVAYRCAPVARGNLFALAQGLDAAGHCHPDGRRFTPVMLDQEFSRRYGPEWRKVEWGRPEGARLSGQQGEQSQPSAVQMISDLRRRGLSDEKIAGVLKTQGTKPPPGMADWNEYGIGAAMGERGGQA